MPLTEARRLSPRRVSELVADILPVAHEDMAIRTHGTWLAASAAFNGDKGGHLQNYMKALRGELPNAADRPEIADVVAEPLDLESERAKELQAEMDAEMAMFQNVIDRRRGGDVA